MSGRIALALVTAALTQLWAFGSRADAPPKTFPPLPASMTLAGLPGWLRANTDIPPASLVALVRGVVTVLVDSGPQEASGRRDAVEVRREALSDTATDVIGGRSETVSLEIECGAAQYRVIGRSVYSGNGLTGSARVVAPTATMTDVPPNTDLSFLLKAVCDPKYQPPLAPYLASAPAAPPAVPSQAQTPSAQPPPAAPAPALIAQRQPPPASAATAAQAQAPIVEPPPPPAAPPPALIAQRQPPPAPAAEMQTPIVQPPPPPAAPPPALIAQRQPPPAPAAIAAQTQTPVVQPPPPPAPTAQPSTLAAAPTAARPQGPEVRGRTMTGKFVAQVSAAGSEALAHKLLVKLARRVPEVAGMPTAVERVRVKDAVLFRVSIGRFQTSSTAEAFCARLRSASFPCWVR